MNGCYGNELFVESAVGLKRGVLCQYVYVLHAYVVFARNLLDISAHFKAESGVKSARRFIEKDDFRVCHQSAGNAESLLLTTTQALFDRCANNAMCLRL